MATPYTIQSGFAGMARDYPRDGLPGGYVWNLQDYFPNKLGAPLRKRGGWTYASSTFGTASISRIAVASFTSGNQTVAIDSATSTSAGPSLYTVSGGTGTLVGSITSGSAAGGANPIGNLVYYAGYLLIPYKGGSGNLRLYNGTSISTAAVSSTTGGGAGVIQGQYAAVYKDRAILSGSIASASLGKRVFFSKPGDPSTWYNNESYIDASNTVTGLAALQNTILVFSAGATERIRGSIPPPGSDMVLEKVTDYGCVDFRSIAVWQNRAVYADTNGVYMSDGASTIDLAAQGGMSTYYRTLLASYTTSWRLTGGVFRNYYFLVVNNGSGGTFQDCLVCDLLTRTWFRVSNFNFRDFAEAKGTLQDFYGACGATNRIARITDIFQPTSSNTTDGDGTAVLPVVELPMVRGWMRFHRKWVPATGKTHWRRLYLGYDVRDSGSTPTLSLSYLTSPDATSYTTLTPAFTATTAYTRDAVSFGGSGARGGKILQELGLEITQSAASSDTRIYNVEAEYETIEPSAL